MMEEGTLERGFGQEAGRWFHELLEESGVEMIAGEALAASAGRTGSRRW